MIGLAIRRHSAGAMSRLFASVRSCLPRKQTGTEPNEKWKERERVGGRDGIEGGGREDGRGRDRDGWGRGGVREVKNSELHYQIEILHNSLFLQSVLAKLYRHGWQHKQETGR